jgi:hypothetical protein
MIRMIGRVFVVTGAAGFVGAVGWWFMFFHQMLGDNVKQVSGCFYSTTLQCAVADAAGSMLEIPPYDPKLLWGAGAVAAVGLLIGIFAPE